MMCPKAYVIHIVAINSSEFYSKSKYVDILMALLHDIISATENINALSEQNM